MSEENATHTVAHPKLFLSVGGKLQHVPKGSSVSLSDAVAKGLGGKVFKIGTAETVVVDEKADKKADKKADEKADKK